MCNARVCLFVCLIDELVLCIIVCALVSFKKRKMKTKLDGVF